MTAEPTGSATAALTRRWDAVMMATYGTPPVALVSGSGCTVTDADGVELLDLVGGIAVSSLGHAHPAVVDAVARQVAVLAHSSNLAVHEPGVALAERLDGLLGGGWRVFFTNDGAGANEAMVKLALRARPGRRRFVAAEGSFHGRTMGALALTGKPAAREPFAPYAVEVTFVPYGDAAALTAAVGPDVAAVVLEPVQGEGGVVVPPAGYLAAARDACDAAGSLLAVDEVQSGIGRTGEWFAHQPTGVAPDVVTVAKGLGGGLPIGACLARGDAGLALRPGDHGSTFGGNPVSCAAALAVLDTIDADGLLAHVRDLGERWAGELTAAGGERVVAVRGAGLWRGIVLADGLAAPAVETAARSAGFLVNAVRPDVVRLAPPLVLTTAEAARFATALPGVLDTAQALG